MTFSPNTTLLNGKYRIDAPIGAGAFGEVYRATHLALQAPRALKILRRDAPGVGSTEFADYAQRFQLEAQLGAQLNNQPHIIQVHDFERDGERLILVMEYASDGSLADRIDQARKSGQPIPVDEVIRIALEVADGLAAIHALDVVHRDLKPSNILFDAQGHAKIADLGLAQVPGGPSMRSRLSQSAPHPGTPAYMSPEQINTSEHLSPTSDVYALGAVLFEVLTGRLVKNVRPGTPVDALRAEIPQWLNDLVAKMLADNPRERPWDGAEIVAALRADEAEARRQQAERQREVEEARREAEGKARREADERQHTAQLARQVAEENARRDADDKAKRDAEEQKRPAAERKAKEEADRRVREDQAREAAARAEIERLRKEPEGKARHEATVTKSSFSLKTLTQRQKTGLSIGFVISVAVWALALLSISPQSHPVPAAVPMATTRVTAAMPTVIPSPIATLESVLTSTVPTPLLSSTPTVQPTHTPLPPFTSSPTPTSTQTPILTKTRRPTPKPTLQPSTPGEPYVKLLSVNPPCGTALKRNVPRDFEVAFEYGNIPIDTSPGIALSGYGDWFVGCSMRLKSTNGQITQRIYARPSPESYIWRGASIDLKVIIYPDACSSPPVTTLAMTTATCRYPIVD